jgi:hypothetical protein
MTDPIVYDHNTVSYQGRTYRLGQGGTPLTLTPFLPDQIPGWREIPSPFWQLEGVTREYSRAYVHPDGLRVIVSATIYDDRKRWLHVSVSHRGNRLPQWREMCEVKDAFCGPRSTAYQVHPPTDKHISIHDKVLHLWVCLDGPVTPDFTRGGETI